MSTFDGIIEEIAGISVDSFEEQNLTSSIYFLSHVHSDHMRGFSSSSFRDKLKEPGVYLYSSPVTTKMLQRWLPECGERFLPLTENSPDFIEHPATKKVITVRSIPAGHCLGSIMLLFEYAGKNVLYTGDFRVNTGELRKFKQFNDVVGQVKTIDKVYLDATFCLDEYRSFPSRDESIEAVCRACGDWLEQDERNVVHIHIPANFGSEALFVEVSKRLQMPIYVGEKSFDIYRYLPNLDGVFTRREETTRISGSFSCKRSSEFCLVVRPSAMAWPDWKKGDKVTREEKDQNRILVCYSSHSSYEEIVEFLQYLKPVEVRSIVERKESKEEMYRLIGECMRTYKKSNVSPVKTGRTKFELNLLPARPQTNEHKCSLGLDSPPKKKR